GNGRPHRRDTQGRDHPGGRKARVDEEARQAPADAGPERAAGRRAGGAGGLWAGAVRRWARAGIHVRQPAGGRRDRAAAAATGRGRHRVQRPEFVGKFPGGNLCQPGERQIMNFYAIRAIYMFEMARAWRTLMQSVASPVISTALYFVVFGSAIGSHMVEIDGISYGAFIVPGMIMLSLLTQSVANASFGIYMPRFSGTIYEIHSAPISYIEIVTGYVGAAASKSVILGLIMLATARLFVDFHIEHPVWMLGF